MSDAGNPSFPDFGKLVPGFDFLQNLAKQASGGAAQKSMQMPSLGGWVAPTLNVEELDKRIQELKTVQFWLDQNTTALKATIQALELQKMTLATLKDMNFNMGEIANAFKLKPAESGATTGSTTGATFAGFEVPPSIFQSNAKAAPVEPEKAPAAASGVVDPMQWWGALTQQFQAIATDAMNNAGKKVGSNPTTGMASEAVKKATEMAKGMAETATKSVTDGAAAMNSALLSTQAWPSPTAVKTATRTKAPVSKTAPSTTAAKKTTR